MATTSITKIAALIVVVACLIHCVCSVPAKSLQERRDSSEVRQSDSGRTKRNVEIKMPWVLDSLKQQLYAQRQNDMLRNILENEDTFAKAGRK